MSRAACTSVLTPRCPAYRLAMTLRGTWTEVAGIAPDEWPASTVEELDEHYGASHTENIYRSPVA